MKIKTQEKSKQHQYYKIYYETYENKVIAQQYEKHIIHVIV